MKNTLFQPKLAESINFTGLPDEVYEYEEHIIEASLALNKGLSQNILICPLNQNAETPEYITSVIADRVFDGVKTLKFGEADSFPFYYEEKYRVDSPSWLTTYLATNQFLNNYLKYSGLPRVNHRFLEDIKVGDKVCTFRFGS